MDVSNLTLITLAWELHQQGMPKLRIAQNLGKNRETIHLWLKGIEEKGLLAFLEHYQQAKKGARRARRVDPLIKRWIWDLREREAQCCGQKIAYFLERERGVRLSVPKIHEVLHEKYVLRSKWRKQQARGPVPHASRPRQVLQLDTVMFGGLYAFTGIDIYTREADVLVSPALTASYGCAFLKQAMARRFGGYAELIQTDGGSEFKESFASRCISIVPATEQHAPTRRTSRRTLRALIAQCARSAWAGRAIRLKTANAARQRRTLSWSVIITTGLTWGLA